MPVSNLPTDEEDLVAELTRVVLEQTAPEEVPLFRETAREYFDDPDVALKASSSEETVGFGLELALITPAVLAIVTPVVKFLLSVVAEASKDEARPMVKQWVRALFKRDHGEATRLDAAVQELTQSQARRVREIAHAQALQVGLAEQKANLLADAVVGNLWVAG